MDNQLPSKGTIKLPSLPKGNGPDLDRKQYWYAPNTRCHTSGIQVVVWGQRYLRWKTQHHRFYTKEVLMRIQVESARKFLDRRVFCVWPYCYLMAAFDWRDLGCR